jgi:HK97 gp10 family phage protein
MSIKVQGLESIIRRYKEAGVDIRKRVEVIVTTTALEGRNEAVKKAPAAFGKLRQSIAVEKVSSLEQSVVANADYAPYVEFGTGGKVSVPSEWSQLASEFKGQNFSFDDQLERMRNWCRLKGIDERAAYPILITVLEKGLEPRPFMYPAWQLVKKNFRKEMEKLPK